MNQKELLSYVEEFYRKGYELIQKKNSDYADPEKDAFKNFRNAETVGVDFRRAILVRISDKIARVSNLLSKEAQVSDETLEDTLIDCANYCAILSASLQNRKTENDPSLV